jgi:hypothetical protein
MTIAARPRPHFDTSPPQGDNWSNADNKSKQGFSAILLNFTRLAIYESLPRRRAVLNVDRHLMVTGNLTINVI